MQFLSKLVPKLNLSDAIARKHAKIGATTDVIAPAGPLGLTLVTVDGKKKTLAAISAIANDSPLKDVVAIGWILLEINGAKMHKGDAAMTALSKDEALVVRELKFIDAKAEEMLFHRISEAYTTKQETVTVDAPKGALGLTFVGEKSPIVYKIQPASPLVGLVGVSWRLLAVDDIDVSRAGREDATRTLTERAANEKRVLKFHVGERKSPLLLILCACGVAYVLYVMAASRLGLGEVDFAAFLCAAAFAYGGYLIFLDTP